MSSPVPSAAAKLSGVLPGTTAWAPPWPTRLSAGESEMERKSRGCRRRAAPVRGVQRCPRSARARERREGRRLLELVGVVGPDAGHDGRAGDLAGDQADLLGADGIER